MSMRFWVDVTDASGERYGAGPITSVKSWTSSRELDRAGRFSFDMAGEDPRASYCQSKRYAHCYRCDDDGVPELIGSGIIDSVKRKSGNPMTMTVSGGCIGRELSYRSVHDLAIENLATETPNKVWNYQPLDVGDDVWTDPVEAYDDDPNQSITEAGLTWHTAHKSPCYVYIGRSVDFEAIVVTMGTRVNDNHPAGLRAKYWNGDTEEWEELNITEDGTTVTTAEVDYTMGQSGTITFVPPPLWGTKTLNGAGPYYWVQLYMDPTGDHTYDWQEVDVKTRYPTDTGLADIMAFVPSGWTLDEVTGHAATEDTEVMLYYSGESVLQALTRLADKTGEHFRIDSDRKVVWLQDDNPAASCYVVGFPAADGMPLADNPYAGMIVSIDEDEDTYEIISRIYPRGGGFGDTRPDLVDCTRSPPAGYTLSAVNNYIECDAAAAAYGRIEEQKGFSEIVALSTTDTQRENAANQLYDIALTYLQKHSASEKFYRMRLVKLPALIQPGEALNVTYVSNPRNDESSPPFNIRDDYWVIEVSDTFGDEGLLYTDVLVSTIDRAPQSDDEMLLQDIVQGRASRALPIPNSVVREVGSAFLSDIKAQSIGNANRIQGYNVSAGEPASYESLVWDDTYSVWRPIDIALSAPGTYGWGDLAGRALIVGQDEEALALYDDMHRAILRISQAGDEYFRLGLPDGPSVYWDHTNSKTVTEGETLSLHSVTADKLMLDPIPYNFLAYGELVMGDSSVYQTCEVHDLGLTMWAVTNTPATTAEDILDGRPGIKFQPVVWFPTGYEYDEATVTKIAFDGEGPGVWAYGTGASLRMGSLTTLKTLATYSATGFTYRPIDNEYDAFMLYTDRATGDFRSSLFYYPEGVEAGNVLMTWLPSGWTVAHGDAAPSLGVTKDGVTIRDYLAFHEDSADPPSPPIGALVYDRTGDYYKFRNASGIWRKLTDEAI